MIIAAPGQWFASTNVTVLPSMTVGVSMGKIMILDQGT